MPMGVYRYARAYLNLSVRTCAYIHGVGFCIAYSNYRVFLGPQLADKQEKRSAFFDVWNHLLLLTLRLSSYIFPS